MSSSLQSFSCWFCIELILHICPFFTSFVFINGVSSSSNDEQTSYSAVYGRILLVLLMNIACYRGSHCHQTKSNLTTHYACSYPALWWKVCGLIRIWISKENIHFCSFLKARGVCVVIVEWFDYSISILGMMFYVRFILNLVDMRSCLPWTSALLVHSWIVDLIIFVFHLNCTWLKIFPSGKCRWHALSMHGV